MSTQPPPCIVFQVQVYRLITNNTYELRLFERACLKLSLEHALLQSGGFGAGANALTAHPTSLATTAAGGGAGGQGALAFTR